MSGRLRAVPGFKIGTGYNSYADDHLEADLLPSGTPEELGELQLDMEEAVSFAEELRAAYQDLRPK